MLLNNPSTMEDQLSLEIHAVINLGRLEYSETKKWFYKLLKENLNEDMKKTFWHFGDVYKWRLEKGEEEGR